MIADVAPSCAWVAERAGHVSINTDKIHDYCLSIVSKYHLTTDLGADNHFVSDDREEMAAYVVALDSVNFGSGYFHIARKTGVEFEYQILARGLKKWFEQGMFNTPRKWCDVSASDFARVLMIPLTTHPMLDELLSKFAHHLRMTGKKIVADYHGQVMSLLDASDFSALKLADTVAGWGTFYDAHMYKGKMIPIMKRAQILASDMNLALKGLSDMDKLTIFADNMVPHVLRHDGILTYSHELMKKINHGYFIEEGCHEEVEIRACAVHVVELMKKAAGYALTSVNIDHMLWHRGYEPDIYELKTHRTLTTNY